MLLSSVLLIAWVCAGTGAVLGLLVLKPGKGMEGQALGNYQEMDDVIEAVRCCLDALNIWNQGTKPQICKFSFKTLKHQAWVYFLSYPSPIDAFLKVQTFEGGDQSQRLEECGELAK